MSTTPWPPPHAEPLDVQAIYGRLTEFGLVYGPAFQGLQKAWRRGEELFAEVTLDDHHTGDYRLHPALLDACLHALVGTTQTGAVLPFAASGIVLSSGAVALRARFTPTNGDGVSLAVVDADGTPVLSAASLVLRPPAREAGDALFGVEWVGVKSARGGV
ncbi:polyketide synthase dehydratase domain-containing protein, partial [Mycolicibacter kumamotonensis]|uniref:polyketide synthase dehydratase domain-containing protein n=1 Tax=Mycolicibacter kumamotonensis TaxID=354243 RepID=UPI003B3B9691